ncbi:Uncharacterised protein [Mycobacteroides abscessus subsp. abscessus]|uniref:CPBP family glutamic-type intramembrane protease n=1 Tax=Mycobacteroides abscessus TaxID=36809 RepID=UPI00092B5ACC|nr:CPBP family glutamic-type intramembrane protease [Mycobacteroides abscessus]SHU26851.1 Uncharacterised protein [Mycobacteroides abscessus subsp. abscessus]
MGQATTSTRWKAAFTFKRCVALFMVSTLATLIVPGVLRPQPASVAPYIGMAVTAIAASIFGLLLTRTSPQGSARRVAVYGAAIASTQGPAIVSAVAALTNPERYALPAKPFADYWAPAIVVAWALLSLAAFYLVKTWRCAEGPRLNPAERRWTSPTRLGAAGAISVVGLVAALYVRGWLEAHLGVSLNPNTAAHGGTFAQWLREIAAMVPAGFVEEPVFVGVAVLLWPWRTMNATRLIGIAALTSLARTLIHLYYASGQHGATQLAMVAVIALWCAIWSTANLLAVYLSKSLLPVMIVHGLYNLQITSNGDWAIGPTLSRFGVLCLAVILVAGGLCGLPILQQRLNDLEAKHRRQPPAEAPAEEPEAPQMH